MIANALEGWVVTRVTISGGNSSLLTRMGEIGNGGPGCGRPMNSAARGARSLRALRRFEGRQARREPPMKNVYFDLTNIARNKTPYLQ